MKKLLGAAVVLAYAIAGTVLAQTSHTESTTKHTGPGPDTKTKTETVVGIVKEYEAGKSIEITGPDKKEYEFELDENARVSGNIVVGKMARVEYRKDDSGREHVVVISDSTKATKMDHAHGKSAQTAKLGEATVGGRMHTETTTKHSGPGPDTKTKTEVVLGTVKDYEAGKKITVTGPDDKDHSFDLDENVVVKTGVAVGQMVQVEYTKTETGEKVMVLAPSMAKKKVAKKTY